MASAITHLLRAGKPALRCIQLSQSQLKAATTLQKVPMLEQQRHSSYRSSDLVQPLEEYPEVEVIHNAPEWKYVERLLPPTLVPQPTKKETYPSGWLPPVAEHQYGYHVARTKNHMLPVYLLTSFRGQRRLTVVRRVQGDIWSLERELRAVVETARNGKICASRVNEMTGQIYFHGDYVKVLLKHLATKGF